MEKRRGEITALRDLFAKYKKTLIAPQKTVELEVLRVVGELTQIKLKEEQISYTVSSRTVAIKAPGLMKQEIKMKHGQIMDELEKRLGKKNSPQHLI